MLLSKTRIIQGFEWEALCVGEKAFTQRHFDSLVTWQDRQQDVFFSVGHNKISFQQWVGVIQVGQLIIEVLPKVAKGKEKLSPAEYADEVKRWKSVLVDMLRKTGRLKVRI